MTSGAPNQHRPPIADDLDAIADRAEGTIAHTQRSRLFARVLRGSLPLLVILPVGYVFVQLVVWQGGGSPRVMPWVAVALIAAAAPLAAAWVASRGAGTAKAGRGASLGEADRQLQLEGRLRAADEFLGRGERSGFEQAAIEDAAQRSAAARAAELAAADAPLNLGGRALAMAGAGALAIGLAAWVGTLPLKESGEAASPSDVQTASKGDPLAPEIQEEDEQRGTDAEEPSMPPAEIAKRRPQPTAAPEKAESAPDISEDVKESSGKTGSGRSSGALSSSAASESRSAPSTQGQSSKPAPKEPSKKKEAKKKPKPVDEAPAPEERPEDEESGSTAGKGSSKGSNKNPTASDWKSRDQVTESDDQEIEDDEETDDDEEEQENRGGVQPSLRDRRPPVSRDLQIGFGNRPNPDANGRGGPSEQKKSRGVASLVLGVPIPDRIKGRPGPGPTKITQERIEPQAEEPKVQTAADRGPSAESFGGMSSLDLDPALRDLVRKYFLGRRRDTP